MRILSIGNMYPPHHLGGYELTWHSAVEHLRARGHEVRVLTTDFRRPDPDPTIEEQRDTHRELGWYWRDHRFPRLSARHRLALERGNARVLRRHLRELRPDVVNWWAMGGMSLSLIERVRRLGLPAVGVVGDDWMVYGPQVDGWQRLCRRLRMLGPPVSALAGIPADVRLDEAAHWIFNSDATRRRARDAGWAVPDSSVAHPGIDLASLPRSEQPPWRGRLLYLGRIDPRKGIETAIAALRSLPDATLRIVGGGDEQHLGRLRALSEEPEVRGRVEFDRVGRTEVAREYARADAVLFPVQWQEPWGLVPLEAMAVGRPVVATGTGGSGEYLRDGENCLIFRPADDPTALAAAVERLASDAELRDRLREGGFATAQPFTEEAYNAAIADALERAASLVSTPDFRGQ